jgi:hypothetical protein
MTVQRSEQSVLTWLKDCLASIHPFYEIRKIGFSLPRKYPTLATMRRSRRWGTRFVARFSCAAHCRNQSMRAGYCVPPPAVATPSTICVPPSNWISCLAPSRMLEA